MVYAGGVRMDCQCVNHFSRLLRVYCSFQTNAHWIEWNLFPFQMFVLMRFLVVAPRCTKSMLCPQVDYNVALQQSDFRTIHSIIRRIEKWGAGESFLSVFVFQQYSINYSWELLTLRSCDANIYSFSSSASEKIEEVFTWTMTQ